MRTAQLVGEPARRTRDLQAMRSQALANARAYREQVRSHFERMAPQRQHWVELNRTYYADLEQFYRASVPPGSRVLEIGSGTGDLLAALAPSRGVGVDFSGEFVRMARQRHPSLTFLEMDAEALALQESFDYILLAGTIGYLTDIQRVLTELRRVCTPQTRIITTFHNYLWEPALRLGERVGRRMPQPAQSWLSHEDVANLFTLAGFTVVKRGGRLLLPHNVPLAAPFINRYVAQVPGINSLCLTGYLVARPDESSRHAAGQEATCTVVVPARNERGNIQAVLERMPRLGSHTEIIFVEGHSTDGTLDEIYRVADLYADDWDIKVLRQSGSGKGDAVRQAFDRASGDVLIILDADLTVPPEDLPKFFDAVRTGRAELANGCRMIYQRSSAAMPLLNTIANKFFGTMFSYLLDQPLKDTLCGTKALWRRDYQKIASMRALFGEFDPFGDFDLLFGAARLNLKIVDIPVRYEERTYGKSNIRHFKELFVLLKMCAYASERIKFS